MKILLFHCLSLLTIILPGISCSQQSVVTSRQASLKAIELAGGRGLFRKTFEVAVSKRKNEIIVLFRRPTSSVIATPGRLPTKDIWSVTFQKDRVITQELDKNTFKKPFDNQYTEQQDRKFTKAALTACRDLWKDRDFSEKEFALGVFEVKEGYFVTVTHIPYTPDAGSMVRLTKDFKIKKQLSGFNLH